MAWLCLIFLLAVPVGLVLLSLRKNKKPETDRTPRQVIVGLYAIRRRLEVAQFKTDLRRDAAQARRVLRDELNGQKREQP
jgi:hypothetical protein